MSKITVMVKEPGKPWVPREIENRLGDVQKLVGGYIEAVTLLDNLALIVDEEGKLKGKAPNFRLMGDVIVGTAVLVGVAGDELTDLPEPETMMDALGEAVMWCD